jgi:hypothetical protein
MLIKLAIRLRLWSLRKNVRGRRGVLILVEQLHPFIGIKYPRDEPLASELTRSFPFPLLAAANIREHLLCLACFGVTQAGL